MIAASNLMKIAAIAIWGAIFALVLLCRAPAEEAVPTDEAFCKPVVFEGRRYVVCNIDARRHEITISWRGARNAPYGTIGNYLRELRQDERSHLMFAMNAGMYESDLRPVGLLIERGKELSKVNIGDGVGNFYWKPNGIFFVGKRNVGIRTTDLYLADPPEVEYATQSGPMLVLNGAIDGQMLASTSSRNIRNAVGVQDEHTAIFAISTIK